MFYLKYRPQKIAQLDNEDRRALLSKVLQQPSRIPHAFLLTGPKGTGKTSTARIIAKALNCEKNIFATSKGSYEPCDDCSTCQDIMHNRFLDVYELDAASNRGIDDIRSLRDQVGFAPSSGRYKIYIIDEVHMLTREAFNALLKTLEEPPSFVVFILATTESHKLPETIVSRCVPINFTKATIKDLLQSLKRVVNAEKLTVSPLSLSLIAQRADGSFRDGVKLLELVARTTDLSDEQIEKFVFSQLAGEPHALLELLDKKKLPAALSWLKTYTEKGGSASYLIEVLLEMLHDALLLSRGVGVGTDKLKQLKFSVVQISKLIKLLFEAYNQTKYTPIDMLPLMIAVSEYAEEKKT